MSDLFFFKDDDLIEKAKVKLTKTYQANKHKDVFEFRYTDVEPIYLTDAELVSLAGSILLFDVECFQNFFMVAFRTLDTGKIVVFEMNENEALNIVKLQWVLSNFCVVGFNSKNYDIPILQLALKGANCLTLHKASTDIIVNDVRLYKFREKYKLYEPTWNNIDLIEVTPLRGSLKLYAGRLHSRRMQDLPIAPTAILSVVEKHKIKIYCFNDLENTSLLFKELESQLELRDQMSTQYGVDLRSKSDAQIAETVITSELNKLNPHKCKRPDIPPGTDYRYKVPKFIGYRTAVLQAMLQVVRDATFTVGNDGYIPLPESIGKLALPLGCCVYKMGIGGLHSTEKVAAYTADDDTLLIDRDVVSYYPQIILNQSLYPKHLGRPFLSVYRDIVIRRIEAKKAGNKVVADSLKITINGSFGKLGSKWSVLYAPDLMIQVTVTGQLCLLMLIEMIEDAGIPVVSANTDGIVIKCPVALRQVFGERVAWWEQLTGFQTEEATYRAVYSRDVNNYVAHKDDGKCKVKGTYSERGSAGNSRLSKNPENLICNDAVIALIENGTPIADTIINCRDIRRFVTIRNVTGGAVKSGIYLGKVIRWYYSTQMQGEINRATNEHKVPNTDAARPLMELPDTMPTDVDYQRYIQAAQEILYDIGYTERPIKYGALFDES